MGFSECCLSLINPGLRSVWTKEREVAGVEGLGYRSWGNYQRDEKKIKKRADLVGLNQRGT